MTEDRKSVSFRMPEQLLERLEDVYGEDAPYEDRTEAIVEAIKMATEDTSREIVNPHYDYLITEYVNALRENNYERVEEAEEEILEHFPDTELAGELESEN